MTESATEPSHRSGVFVSTGDIYKEVLELKETVTKLKTQMALIAFIGAPVLSVFTSTIVSSVMNGVSNVQ